MKFINDIINEYYNLCEMYGWKRSIEGFQAYVNGVRQARRKWIK